MKNREIKKIISLVLVFCFAFSFNISFASTSESEGALSDVLDYFMTQQNGELTTFWQSIAVFGSGADLSDGWTLPEIEVTEDSLTTDIAGAVINELIKGSNPSTEIEMLKQRQNINTGGFDNIINGHIWAMIALDTAKVDYNIEGAVEYLLSQQKENGSFSLSASLSDDNTDITSMAALALSLHKDKSEVLEAIDRVKQYLKLKQTSNGGFTSTWGANANCTAMSISALVSMGEDPLSQEWTKEGNTPLDHLLSFKTQDGGFGFSSNQHTNKMATEQAAIALGDIISARSVFKRISEQNSKTVISVEIVTPEGVIADKKNIEVTNFDLSGYGVGDTQKPVALHAIVTALEIEDKEIEVENGLIKSVDGVSAGQNGAWMFYVNNKMPCDNSNPPVFYSVSDYEIVNNDKITLFLTNDFIEGLYSYFDKTSVSAKSGEEFELALYGSDILADMMGIGEPYPIYDAQILVNNQPLTKNGESIKTDEQGRVAINLDEPGEYIITAEFSHEDKWILARCLVLVIPSQQQEQVFRTIDVRIEGSGHTISKSNSFVAAANGQVTAMDALISYLDLAGIEYAISPDNSYIISIDGESAGQFGGWDGWFYTINDTAPDKGMNEYILNDFDELVVYYGDFTTYIPEVDINPEIIKKGDNIDIYIKTSYIEYNPDYTPKGIVELELSDVDVDFAGQSYKTDAEGRVTISTTDIGAGEYVIKISKENSGGCPFIIRKEIPVNVYNSKNISIRFEGIFETIAEADGFEVLSHESVTALDAATQFLESESIDYVLSDAGYISSVDGLASGHFGGWDGWMYIVNDSVPGALYDCVLNNGDKIVVYYGDFDTYIPDIVCSVDKENNIVSFKVTETHTEYDESWNPIGEVTNDIEGATVSIDGLTFTTDSLGEALAKVYLESGEHRVKIFKSKENGLPFILSKYISVNIDWDTPDEILVKDTPLIISQNSSETALKLETEETEQGKKAVLPLINVKGELADIAIMQDSEVTADSSWDGVINLPKAKSVSLSNKDIYSSFTVGSDSNKISFSEPVRVLIKGAASKKIGILDNNSFKQITNELDSDSPQALAADKEAGIIAVGGDMAVWTRHFSTFVAYTDASGPGNPGGGNPVSKASLYAKGDSQKGVILKKITVNLKDGDNPITILQRQLPGKVEVAGGYVRSIDGLAEFDKGPGSGWMYSINGVFYQESAEDKILKDGDEVKWLYTLNFGDDLEDQEGSKGGNFGGSGLSTVTKEAVELSEALEGVLEAINAKLEPEEFDIFVLAANGIYNDSYRQVIESIVERNQGEFRKSTDLSKLIITAYALGMDVNDVCGYNLIERLKNFENIIKQGTNAPIFALIAYDALGDSFIDDGLNKREQLISYILDAQNSDGGFALAVGSDSDIDITAMALYALNKYQDRSNVSLAIDKALGYLSKNQLINGGFSAREGETSESISQVIIALATLGIDIYDSRFIKPGGDLYTELLEYAKESGGYSHIKGNEANDMATYQAALALTALNRFKEGLPALYDLSDASTSQQKPQFLDLDGVEWAKNAIEVLAQKQIISGTGGGNFSPNDSLTREQLVKLLVLAFDIKSDDGTCEFIDVKENEWYYPYIAAAKASNIVAGVSGQEFGVGLAVTRQDMAVMIYRILNNKQIKVNVPTKDIVDLFADGSDIADYAKMAVMVLNENNIIMGTPEGRFNPNNYCTRAEAAVIIYRLLNLIN